MMALHTLSPLDGRYESEAAPLRGFFSEFAYTRTRVQIELDFLGALAKTGLIPAEALSGWTPQDRDFTEDDARKIQEYEKSTQHDIKAIEYFLRERIPSRLHPWIHFGLTSEDINNIALALALRDSRDQVLLPALHRLLQTLREFAKRYRASPFLARTHGQPAVPTTLGKEIAVFIARLEKCRREVAKHQFEAKLTGAVGNFNALQAAAPHVDWRSFGAEFILSFDLQPNPVTTQILPYDNWLRYFSALRLTNVVLTGYAQDIWRYISDGIITQKAVETEVGSSTMPHKVNPIHFENAEGNLGIANGLLTHFTEKLAISRLQRDLSDSTVRRTFGVALGHTLLAWSNITRGMHRLAADEERMRQELNEHWETIAEGAQTILRAAGHGAGYEELKTLTRGRPLDEDSYRRWIQTLDIAEETRARLAVLSPATYMGLAAEIVDNLLSGGDKATGSGADKEKE